MNILSVSTQEDNKNVASILDKTANMNNKKEVCKILIKNIQSIISFFYSSENIDVQKHILYVLFKNLTISSTKKYKIFRDYTQRFLEISSYNYKNDSISFLFNFNKTEKLITCCKFIDLEFKTSRILNGYSFVNIDVIHFYAPEENFMIKISSIRYVELDKENTIIFHLVSEYTFKFKVDENFQYLDKIKTLLLVKRKEPTSKLSKEDATNKDNIKNTNDGYKNNLVDPRDTIISRGIKEKNFISSLSKASILRSPIKCSVGNKNIISNNLNIDFVSKYKKKEIEIQEITSSECSIEDESNFDISNGLGNEKNIKFIKDRKFDKKDCLKIEMKDYESKESSLREMAVSKDKKIFKIEEKCKNSNIFDILLQKIEKIKLLKIKKFPSVKRSNCIINRKVFNRIFKNIQKQNKKNYETLKNNLKKIANKNTKKTKNLEKLINKFILKFLRVNYVQNK